MGNVKLKKITALKGSLLVMGFTATTAQIIIIRELIVVFHGNELFIGIILGSWLIMEAAGSYLARRRAEHSKRYISSFAILQILVGLSSIVSILLIRSFRYYLDIPVGEVLGIHVVAVVSLLVLAPIALLDGAMFPFGCRNLLVISKKEDVSARCYLHESIGSFIAGLAFVFYFIHYFNSIELATIILILNLCSVILYLTSTDKLKVVRNLVLMFLLITVISFSWSVPKLLHEASSRLLWYEFTLVDNRNSVYGNIAVIKEHGQYTFFANGVPYATTPIPAVHIEELAHFPMLFHYNPAQVLVIGGGAGGLLRELLKHPVQAIDYAEQDPLIIETFRRFPTPLTEYELNHPKVEYHPYEGRLFLRKIKTPASYDLIITNLSIPSTLQMNRYYTKEFFELAKKQLREKGILALRLPGSETFLSTEKEELNRTIHATLQAVFPYVRIIIGEQNIFIASNHHAVKTTEYMTLIERFRLRDIQADLMSEWYIRYKMDDMRFGHLIDIITASDQKILNKDNTPRGVFESLLLFNSISSPFMVQVLSTLDHIPDIYYFILAIIIIAIFAGTQTKRFLNFSIASTGFVSMLLSILLILSFQIYYGHVYHYIGILTALFMLGSAVGAFVVMKKTQISIISIEIGLIFLLLCAYLFIASGPEARPTQIIIFTLMALSGLLTGMAYPAAVKLADRSCRAVSATAGKFYALDLFGAFFGAIITAVIFIPMMGLENTLLFAMVIKAGSLMWIYKKC